MGGDLLMQFFQDTATGKTHAFEADVVVSHVDGAYSLTTAGGVPLVTPATLTPVAPPTSAEVSAPTLTMLSARRALCSSDITMHRIVEAVSLGLNSWTAADVVAFVTYRRDLRAIANGSTATTSLPSRPPNPAGT
jgi:hypothetical protein